MQDASLGHRRRGYWPSAGCKVQGAGLTGCSMCIATSSTARMAKAVMEAMGTITQLKKNVGGTQGKALRAKTRRGEPREADGEVQLYGDKETRCEWWRRRRELLLL